MVLMMVRFFGANRSWKEGLSIAPFALFAGACFVVPYMLAGVLLGPEFPSMIGAMVGLAIVVPAARRGFLIPKDTWDFPESSSGRIEWIGKLEIKLDDVSGKAPMSTFMGWVPYVLLAIFLVASRTIEPLKSALTSFACPGATSLARRAFPAAFSRCTCPAASCSRWCWSPPPCTACALGEVKAAFHESSRTLLGAGFVLLFTIPMVRILINSGRQHRRSGLDAGGHGAAGSR